MSDSLRPPPRDPALVLWTVGGTLIALAVVAVALAAASGGRLHPGGHATPALHLHAPHWPLLMRQGLAIKLHLGAALTALMIGVVLMVGVKGSTLHRTLGWTWVAAMGATQVQPKVR